MSGESRTPASRSRAALESSPPAAPRIGASIAIGILCFVVSIGVLGYVGYVLLARWVG